MNPAVVIYTKPNCQPCKAAKRLMNRRGVVYNEVDITKEDSARAYVESLGYQAVPVTVVDTPTQPVHWYGANPTLIDMHFGKAA